tara:strand:+ start:1015 stop:1335 length:321 start_codon:yes stop_codon:yes gene_type:complete
MKKGPPASVVWMPVRTGSRTMRSNLSVPHMAWSTRPTPVSAFGKCFVCSPRVVLGILHDRGKKVTGYPEFPVRFVFDWDRLKLVDSGVKLSDAGFVVVLPEDDVAL